MKPAELLDLEQFAASLTNPNKSIFRIWSETALEISPEKHRAIAQLREIYLEIPSEELKPRQIVSFVEALLEALPSDDNRRTLIRAEALQFRKFERS